MSRLTFSNNQNENFEVQYLLHWENNSVSLEEIMTETRSDHFLQRIIHRVVKNSWTNCSIKEKPFKKFRQLLCIENDILLKGTVPVIPEILRERILNSAHSTHGGILATNLLIRNEAWWPNFSVDVERKIKCCSVCLEIKTKRNTELDKWPIEKIPWSRIHMDHAMIPNIGYVLILVDSFSGWPEAYLVKDRSVISTVDVLRSIFSRLGVPFTLVTDNASEFCSEDLLSWLNKIGCRPYKSPPYHPQSNGIAERIVRTIKTGMKAWKPEFGNFKGYLDKLLMNYRSLPHGSRNKSAAELMGRQIRSPILCSKTFQPGEKVWVRNNQVDMIVQKGANTFIVAKEGEDQIKKVGETLVHKPDENLKRDNLVSTTLIDKIEDNNENVDISNTEVNIKNTESPKENRRSSRLAAKPPVKYS
jgi:hypothetical protein